MRTALYRLLWAVVLVLDFVPHASAAETGFMCVTEAAAGTIANAIVMNGIDAGRVVGAPYLQSGECFYLPAEVHIDVTYHGTLFVGGHFQIEVVGFTYDGWMQYGLMPVEPLPQDQPAQKRDL